MVFGVIEANFEYSFALGKPWPPKERMESNRRFTKMFVLATLCSEVATIY